MTERTAKLKAELRAYKVAAPISIGMLREDEKDQAEQLEREVITAVRTYVWLTRDCCQLCRGRRADECAGFPDEMHEDPPRSATRGLPPWERFNIKVCGRLCKACHRDVTENRIRIIYKDEARKFLGPISSERVW